MQKNAITSESGIVMDFASIIAIQRDISARRNAAMVSGDKPKACTMKTNSAPEIISAAK